MSEADRSQVIKCGLLRSSPQAWAQALIGARIAPGTVTILCVGPDRDARRAIAGTATMEGLVNAQRAPLFAAPVLVVPPSFVGEPSPETSSGAGSDELRGDLVQAFRDHVKLVRPTCLETAALAEVLRTLPKRSGVYVMDASRYASPGASTQGAASSWVARIASTYRVLLSVSMDLELMVLLDTGEYEPSDPVERQVLFDLEDVSICGGRPEDDYSPDQVERWARLLAMRQDAMVERLVPAHSSDPETRQIALAAALAKANRYSAAWEHVAPYAMDPSKRPAAAAVLWATYALRAGESAVARSLLEHASARARELDEAMLTGALDAACSLEEPGNLPNRFRATFADLYPSSVAPDRVALRHALVDRDYEAAKAAAERILSRIPSDREADFGHTMAATIPVGAHWKAVSAFRRDADFGERAMRLAVADLLALRRCVEALALIEEFATDELLTPAIVRAERAVVEQLLLTTPKPPDLIVDRSLDRFCRRALRVLAEQPENGNLRLDVAEMLGADTIGAKGLALLEIFVVTGPKPSLVPRAAVKDDDDTVGATKEEVAAYIDAVFDASGNETRIGETRQKVELGPHPKMLVDALTIGVRDMAFGKDESKDLDELRRRLHLALVAARAHGDPPDDDVRILRLAACGTAVTGSMQQARDLAEECLQTAAGGSPHRKRLAWIAFADVHNRLRDPLRATLGLACALSIEVPLARDEAGEEYALRARVLRDVGLLAEARQVLAQAGEHFREQGLSHELHRLEQLDMWIRFTELSARGREKDFEGLSLLAGDAARFLDARVSELDSELAPPVMLLTEIIGSLGRAGRSISRDVLAALARGEACVGEPMRRRIVVLSEPLSSAEYLKEAVALLRETRNSTDLGTDIAALVLGARRALRDAVATANAPLAALAIELAADHAIEIGSRPAIPDSTAVVIDGLREVDARHSDVHLISIDSDDRVVRVSQVCGEIIGPVLEPRMDMVEARKWAMRYPASFGARAPHVSGIAAYGAMVEAMQDMQLTIGEPTRTTFVAPGPDLARVPPALFRVNEKILGVSAPVATIPSLTWLRASLSNPARIHPEGQVAWIPASSMSGAALDALAANIQATTSTRSLRISRDPEPPPEIFNAKVAIVGIHGSFVGARGGGSIARDDAGGGRWTHTIAQAVGRARIVVLLMCHGGVVRAHPFANAQLGLPRKCLDEGAACVVAPLWALRVGTAARWLAGFLARIHEAEDAARVCFDVNRALRAVLPHPADWLAMQVYGNPFMG